ncbi:MAG: O-antigen ligase family protein [candidate division WOR-3 bacterium]
MEVFPLSHTRWERFFTSPRFLLLTLGVELLIFIGFLVSLFLGDPQWGVVLLFIPFQLLLWAILFQEDFYILLFFSFIFPLGHVELLPFPYHRYFLFPTTILLLLSSIVTRLVSIEPSPSRRKELSTLIPFLLLILWVVIAGIHGTLRGWGSSKLMLFSILWLEGLIMGYFFATIPKTLAEIKRLLWAMTTGVLLAFLALWFLFILPGGGNLFRGKLIETPFGILNLNTVGLFATTFTGIAFGLLLETQRMRTKLLLISGIFLMLLTLAFSGSRGAWLGLGVSLLYSVFTLRSFWLTLLAIGGGVFTFFIEPLRQVLLMRVTATTPDDPALLGRLIFWNCALRIFKDNWLWGIGAENFRFVKRHYGIVMPQGESIRFHTHNIYLEILTDLGIVGFISFMWLLGGVFVGLHRVLGSEFKEGRGLALGLLAGLIAFFTHGLLDSFTWNYAAVALLAALIGLAIALRRKLLENLQEAKSSR